MAFARAVREVADAPAGGVVVHCQGGKDRTGLVAALLLRLAGVPHEDIGADYSLSRQNLSAFLDEWIAVREGRGAARTPSPHQRLACRVDDPASSRRSSGATATSRATCATRAGRRDDRARRAAACSRDRARALRADRVGEERRRARRSPALVDGELISADSAQVYRGLPILTNQDDPPPRLVAIWPLDHEASVGEYQRLAHAAIDEVLAAGRLPVVVGGTGLYLRAALTALELPPAPRAGRARALGGALRRRGAGARRTHCSPSATRRPPRAVHPNDRRRVVRALELAEAGSLARRRPAVGGRVARVPTLVFGLDVPREELARRIEQRTREMFERGVEDEVRRALAEPLSATARKVLGLREVAELPREQAIERMIVRTRRFAAYQRKWMRRIPGLVSVACRPAAPRRPPMRSSTWHAHGNVYLVVERPEPDARATARALSDGTDGVAAGGRVAARAGSRS